MSELRPAVFLDRDGTINVDKGYLYRREDFEYLEGAVNGLKRLQEWGYLLVIITNQSGVARGYYQEEDFCKLTDWMLADLQLKGVYIDRVYYCPHHPDGIVKEYAIICDCRKPGTGLFYRAAGELGIDFRRSIAIGDKERDLSICNETGVTGILLSDRSTEKKRFLICKNWDEVISSIRSMHIRYAAVPRTNHIKS